MDDICGTHTKPYATKQEINFVYPIGYNILQSDTVSILKRKAVCTIPYKLHIAILERRMNGCAVMLATQSSRHLHVYIQFSGLRRPHHLQILTKQ